MTEAIRKGWSLAKGSAGFNVAGEVWGAHVNGVALFAYQDRGPPRPFWLCVVTGHLTAGASTLDSAMVRGESLAMQYGTSGADRTIGRKEFQKIMTDPARLFTES